eukprot:2651922-Rhodomonas_salina.5
MRTRAVNPACASAIPRRVMLIDPVLGAFTRVGVLRCRASADQLEVMLPMFPVLAVIAMELVDAWALVVRQTIMVSDCQSDASLI